MADRPDWIRIIASAIVVLGSGCRAPSPSSPHSESPACRQARTEILQAIEHSRLTPCETDADCAVVKNPGTRAEGYSLVAHRSDRESLTQRAEDHLDRCGAVHHREPAEVTRVVEAACRNGECVLVTRSD